MRRRRQKNTLLPKMIGLAVLINAVLLPILAHFGAFKNVSGGQRLTPVELVKLPPPEKRPAPPKKTAKKQAAKPRSAGRKAASRPALARRAPSGPPVKVVAAGPAPGSAGGGGDNGIAPSDSGPAAPPSPPVTPPAPAPPPSPPSPAPAPPVPALPPPASVEPTLTAAVPLSQPKPTVPDDLRDFDSNAAFEGVFTVHTDGTASFKMVSSTGNGTLDALAVEAVKHWTFRPATRDGQPVESYLRLRIEFDVNS